MTEAARRRLLQRGAKIGYTGNNLGQLSARAEGVANGTVGGNYTAAQRRSARSIANSLSGSG